MSALLSPGPVDELAGDLPSVASVARPRTLIVTVYGLYARDELGWLSVSTLIQMMARLGVEEAAVRSSISRLKSRGILMAERIDGVAGYALSEQARTILADGDRRIFGRGRATVADGWVMAVFSVPESERRQRHLLRSRLTWLGFGSVGSGVWIAPGRLEAETRDALERSGLAGYVDLFHADHLGFADLREQVARWWDLDSLDELYRQFDAVHEPTLARWRASRRRDDEGDAFADYVRTLTAWRRLPYLDPGLPEALLSPGWAGLRAEATFRALQRRLQGPAQRFADGLRAD